MSKKHILEVIERIDVKMKKTSIGKLSNVYFLMKEGMGCILGGRLSGITPSKFYRRRDWIRKYVAFEILLYNNQKEVVKIFEKIGYYKTNNSKMKKGFKVFKNLFEHPYKKPNEFAVEFGIKSSTVRTIKGRYVKKFIKHTKENGDLEQIILIFDEISFLNRHRTLKERPRVIIDSSNLAFLKY